MKKTTPASNNMQALYRAIPSVQQLVQVFSSHDYPINQHYLKRIIQQAVAQLRENISPKTALSPAEIPAVLEKNIHVQLQRLCSPSLQRAINATGIILHTNLGRAPLAAPAITAMQDAAENYSTVELDLATGKRSNRLAHVEELLCMITGAEAAMVVNNCASAIFLVLAALCSRREVPVSRGELVEIGGSFRMPEVMKSSGAKMVEIGTTNKTHLRDYQTAITQKTAALLKVHTSNYRILGFTKSVPPAELAALAHSHSLPLIYDMGCGALSDPAEWGLSSEPLANDVLAAGVDVVTFSGDKLLGGPQSGIIAGKKAYVDKIRKHHLARALRCDKLILAALASTLRLYLQPERLPETLPVARMMTVDNGELRRRAEKMLGEIRNPHLHIEIIETHSQVGSGALPLEKIPAIALQITRAGHGSVEHLARWLREQQPPVVGYVQDEALLLNLRTVREDELPVITRALNAYH